jgi:hypothetical protein
LAAFIGLLSFETGDVEDVQLHPVIMRDRKVIDAG